MLNNEIIDILKSALGLKVNAVGQTRLEQAVRRRIKFLGLDNQDSYAEKLKKSSTEKSQLVEEVVIPETWFYRDGDPFAALEEYVRGLWDTFTSSGLKILSIPCSTGEEPYSIAMALISMGFPAERFHIDAVDISERALEFARAGVYGKKSFRSDDLTFRQHYFTQLNAREYAISQKIKDCVRFSYGNILSPLFQQQFSDYHIIFCKNVLIYLCSGSQGIAIRNLTSGLSANGILFTTPAETGLFTDNGYSPVYFLRGYTLTRTGAGAEIAERRKLAPRQIPRNENRPATPLAPAAQKTPTRAVSIKADDTKKTAAGDSTTLLKKARLLADGGKIDEAANVLESLDQKLSPTAEFYYLLGLVRDVQGNSTEALSLLKKSIYLDPKHTDSLTLLAYLSKRLGDEKGCETYLQRLGRIENEGLISNE